jgi:hypothetical protein
MDGESKKQDRNAGREGERNGGRERVGRRSWGGGVDDEYIYIYIYIYIYSEEGD